MINKDNIEILYPGIVVFRKGLPNTEEIIAAIDASDHWQPWYNVGEQIILNQKTSLTFSNSFPNEQEWQAANDNYKTQTEPVELAKIISDIEQTFYEATTHYFDMYPASLKNWMHGASNVLKYHGRLATVEEIEGQSKVTGSKYDTSRGEAGGTKEHTLPFHTDFYQKDEFEPGLKAEYTVTIYLNDDYIGGEIDYRIFNGTEHELGFEDGDVIPLDPAYGEVPKLVYKPQAGDIIVFPSRPPYYHGVRRVESGIKKFIRMFWMSYLYEKDTQETE